MRLIVVVEGQTEEAFVKSVLAPHLNARGVFTVATIVGKVIAQKRGNQHRGGGQYRSWRKDVLRILAGDRGDDLRVTTLFDLYGLPADFPGLAENGGDADTVRRCTVLQKALGEDIDDHRFIPYLQRHEVETLVLASLSALRELFDAEDDLFGLESLYQQLRDAAPEDVNDGETSAPSKRLLSSVPGYRKTLHGPLAMVATGLRELRRRCPRFDAWVTALEELGRD